MKNTFLAAAITAGSVIAAGQAFATTSYIGSFDVTDGVPWPSNPEVHSALEAAELVFGALADGLFYEISTAGADVGLIDNMAWYAVVGIGPDVFAEDYSLDTGDDGYAGPGWRNGDDVSAYVNDSFFGADQGTNYVFVSGDRTPAPVPLPASLPMALAAAAALGGLRLRHARKS